MPVFTRIGHDDYVAQVLELANQIGADAWTPSFIIGIGRGGLAPAVYLSHATGLPMLSVDHSSEVPDFADAPLVRLAARTREGERLLFLDDINDTGGTIAKLRRALIDAGGIAENIRFATLIDNSGSSQRVDYRARTIDRAETKDWFVFPWEAVAPQSALDDDAAEVPERIA
ncbi:phosphoribosyltransferase [Hephaestia mangrovi]|uniref:phosphoribosyltransferase n=1 Tax=Hephaestia mangrovi TaxID=2873268 RepID=UPI001CA63C3F|nr:phosphoribosyltransferase family protein [Hephaestia mangrovi]MBY8827225.1 phosphoribosyltransferase domain-containing protein [Hephaestia mangrovi]